MSHLHDDTIAELEEKANLLRQSVIEMLLEAGSGHTAGPLGMADIFAAFYFYILKHDPQNPDWEDRDRIMLSNGHIVPIQYAAMAHAGYFPPEELLTLRKLGSRLQGHPERVKLPGLETTSGPLGSGLSQASGMAYGARMDRKTFRVYCLLSDGEHNEGNIWEAIMFAGANKLSNLTAVMDRNYIQINGMTEEVMPLDSLRAKYESFNWNVVEIDGHNVEETVDAVDKAKAVYDKPTLILAHTIPGKGVKEIEHDFTWHGKPPKADEAREFLEELRTYGGKIRNDHTD